MSTAQDPKLGEIREVNGVKSIWVGAWVPVGSVVTPPEGGNAPLRVVDPVDLSARGSDEL